MQHVTVARIVGDLWCQSSDPHRLNFMLEGGVASAPDVRFSNRPSGVKHFQTVHHYKLARAVLVACALQVVRMVLMSLITTRPGDGLNMSAPV